MCNAEAIDIVVLIDKSGSMGGMEVETIGAFNKFLADQRDLEGEAVLTLVLFDHEEDVVYFRKPLQDVERLTEERYSVCGSTSMYDCLGKVASAISYANESGKAIFLIQSDGMENTSRMFSGRMIKDMIAEKEKLGWSFQFIGTGIDAITEGEKFGLDHSKCFSVDKNARGFEVYGSTASLMSTQYRTS